MRLKSLTASFLLACVIGAGVVFSGRPVFASASTGCAQINGHSDTISGASPTFTQSFNAGDKITVTVTSTGLWEVDLFQPWLISGSGHQTGNGSFSMTVPVTGDADVVVAAAVGSTIDFVITCTPADSTTTDSGSVTTATENEPAPPPPAVWGGDPNSTAHNYDGRIGASQADRYAVYCDNGEFQVWDGVNGVKVGSMSYEAIAELPNPASVAIGDNVFIGHSNNELAAVIPGQFEKFGIALDSCIGGGYDVHR